MSDKPRADILVVDDTPANLEVLESILSGEGYQVRPVPSGRIALSAAQRSVPDLIMLDINMPEMDGYETCERLKADVRTADVPVIFLSALAETADKVRAFEVGGVDYMTKPFQYAEVLARVETHLRIALLQRELSQRYQELKKLEGMKDSLTHMIVHDLRSPLTSLMTSLELMAADSQGLSGEGVADLDRGLRSVNTLTQMITALLDVNKMESGEMTVSLERGDLVATSREAVEALSGLARKKKVSIEPDDDELWAVYDGELIRRVLVNLISNALKVTVPDGLVTIRVSRGPSGARIEVIDQGPGVPAEFQQMIFEKFGQIEARKSKVASTGLGLAFCKLAVEVHGGEIGVESAEGEGSTFWLELPEALG
jgi:two-component system sensor histidine kinase/response regulator